MKVKICGISSRADVLMISALKPDYMGFVLNCPKSPRSNTKKQVIELVTDLKIPFVLLFVNESENTILDICQAVSPYAIQLHGDESIELISSLKQKLPKIQIWKAIHLPVDSNIKSFSIYIQSLEDFVKAGCDLFILDSSTKDSYGGTGITCDWDLAAKIVEKVKKPFLLAGGLVPSNVKNAIEKVKPFGVDVSSGVEIVKAKKDQNLVKNFMKAIK